MEEYEKIVIGGNYEEEFLSRELYIFRVLYFNGLSSMLL